MATLRKRLDKWEAQVRKKGYLPHSKSFVHKRDALLWARSLERSMDLGDHLPPRLSTQTLGDVLLRYAKEITPLKKGAFQEQNRINRLLTDPLHKYPIKELTSEVMAQFRDRRLKDGPGACRHDLAIVQHCLNVAIREWSLPLKVNPVMGIRKPPPSRPRTRRLYPGEYEQLHQGTLNMRGKYLWPCIVLALETAMRKGELLSLKWQHVYWEKGLVYLPDTKNGEDRWIPLSPKAQEILQTLPQDTTTVFTASSTALRLSWDRLMQRTQIRGLRFHDLRHEATSRMVENGLSVFQVSLITGHKSMAMVRRYAHLKQAVNPALIGHK